MTSHSTVPCGSLSSGMSAPFAGPQACESDDELHRGYGTGSAVPTDPSRGGSWRNTAVLVSCVAALGVLAIASTRTGVLGGSLTRQRAFDMAMETMPRRQPFSFFDHDGNQKVDLQEMNRALIDDLQYDLTYHQVAQLFRETDLNSDGHIDIDEAAEGVVRPGLRQRTEFTAAERHAHHQRFEFFDHDGDGRIKLQELAYALIEDLRYDLTYAQVADLFRLTDTDDDGYITQEEKNGTPEKPARPAEQAEAEAEAEAEATAPEQEPEEGESLDIDAEAQAEEDTPEQEEQAGPEAVSEADDAEPPAAPAAVEEAPVEGEPLNSPVEGEPLSAEPAAAAVAEVEEELEAEGESLNQLTAEEKGQLRAEDLARVAEAARIAEAEAARIVEEEQMLEETNPEADQPALAAEQALLVKEEQALADVADAAGALLEPVEEAVALLGAPAAANQA